MTRDAGTIRIPAAARRNQILRIVQREGFVSVAGISETLGVSEMTVRRDLEALEGEARIERTFGGALRREAYDAHEPAFDRRRRINAEAKTAIASRAAELIGPGETLGIDVGTTALALAEQIAQRTDLTVFTNNLRAATLLGTGGCPVYVPGGRVRDAELSVVGASAIAYLSDYVLDRVFIGISGLSENGAFDYSIEDTEVKRVLIGQAETVVVLCDGGKFERRSLARIAGLEEIDIVVSDRAPPPRLAAALSDAGVRLITADQSTQTE